MLTVDFVREQMTTNGILGAPLGDDTWADEFARGLGHVVRDNGQWDTYYPWFTQNATAIWDTRSTDLNITWNDWTTQTPSDDTLITTMFASAVAWSQFTAATQPDARSGLHYRTAGTNDFTAGCETHFVVQDDQGNTGTGDWDSGYYKGECAAGKVVVGVSASMSTGEPHEILCCGQ
jgi:hypothetical protein